MKLIAASALAVLLACPAFAKVSREVQSMYCTPDIADFEAVYGEFQEFAFGPLKNKRGFSVGIMEMQSALVLVTVLPDGRMCVTWDYEKPGDPA